MLTTLSYEQSEPLPPPGLHLHDAGDVVRLIRVPRQWMQLGFGIVFPALCVGAFALLGWKTAVLVWRVLAFDPPAAVFLPLVLLAVLPVGYMGFAVFLLLNHLRYGVIPTVLEATAKGIELRAPGFWGISRRHWPAGQVEAVDLRRLHDVFNRREVGDLRIRIKGRWTPLTMRLSHQDAQFPDQAAAAFRRVLGMEAGATKRT